MPNTRISVLVALEDADEGLKRTIQSAVHIPGSHDQNGKFDGSTKTSIPSSITQQAARLNCSDVKAACQSVSQQTKKRQNPRTSMAACYFAVHRCAEPLSQLTAPAPLRGLATFARGVERTGRADAADAGLG